MLTEQIRGLGPVKCIGNYEISDLHRICDDKSSIRHVRFEDSCHRCKIVARKD